MSRSQDAPDQAALLLNQLRGEKEDGVPAGAVQGAEGLGNPLPAGAPEGQVDGHAVGGDRLLGRGGPGAGGGGGLRGAEALGVVPQAAADGVACPVEKGAVREHHVAVLDADHKALGDGGQGEVGVGETEVAAHRGQGQVGQAAAHDGPGPVHVPCDPVGAGVGVQVELQVLGGVVEGDGVLIPAVAGVDAQVHADGIQLRVKDGVGHVDGPPRPEGHGLRGEGGDAVVDGGEVQVRRRHLDGEQRQQQQRPQKTRQNAPDASHV